MLGALRGSFFALICSTALAGGCLAAAAAQPIDATSLPRLPGSRVLYANPSTTNFTTPDTVAVTGELITRALTADGWQKYGPAFAAVAHNPTLQILSFKRGPAGAVCLHRGRTGAGQCDQRELHRGAAAERSAVSEGRDRDRVRLRPAASELRHR